MLQSVALFGQEIKLYDFFNNFAVIVQIVIFILMAKKLKAASTFSQLAEAYFNSKQKKGFLFRWAPVILQLLIMYLPAQILGNLVGTQLSIIFLHSADANYFTNILFFPFYGLIVFSLCKVSVSVYMDLCSFLMGASLICFKIACFFEGCCNGIECASPFFNHKTERYELPIQLIEAACAVLILIVLILLYKRLKKGGRLYPLFMLMYCGSRFISEFWRDDYPDVWGPLKGYHIQCIIGFILGAIYLFVVLKWGDRITAYFAAKNQAFLDKHTAKLKTEKKIVHHKKK